MYKKIVANQMIRMNLDDIIRYIIYKFKNKYEY